jgi:transcriptional regulator of heat shock response
MANVSKSPDSFKIGLSQLMSAPEFREYDRILGLTEFFDQFDQMVEHLHRDMWDRGDTHDVKIFIGTENDDERIKDETMIVSRYRLPRGAEGTLISWTNAYGLPKNIGLMMYVAQVANQLSRTS